jgi:hypothetical protein
MCMKQSSEVNAGLPSAREHAVSGLVALHIEQDRIVSKAIPQAIDVLCAFVVVVATKIAHCNAHCIDSFR